MEVDTRGSPEWNILLTGSWNTPHQSHGNRVSTAGG